MTQPIRKDTKVRLKVGMWLEFIILSRITLQDQKEYFILQDPNGVRHFMEASLYEGYSLDAGKTVNCKVDHINCTGRIFLEPDHPHYVIGECYFFPIRSLTEKEGKIMVVLEDCFKNTIELEIFREDFHQEKLVTGLNCYIRSIKKGVPDLEYYG